MMSSPVLPVDFAAHPRMRPLIQQVLCAARCARYSLISARHLTTTPPIYQSSQANSHASGHSAESYFKEVDSSPPADSSTYQVDASSDAVQRPHSPPSGKYSQAGVGSEAYRVMDKQAPYDPPTDGGAGKKLRYGGKDQWISEKGRGTSRSDEGPEGTSAAGRKPEGKQ